MLPSPCHERDRWRTPVKARNRCRRPLLELPRGEVSAPSPVREWRPFASVIAATPRALNPMSHQPRRPRASFPVRESEDLPVFPREEFGWAYRELSLSLESDVTSDSGASGL